MTDTPMKLVVDLSKPEGEREQYLPLTEEELAQREIDVANAAEREAELEAEEQARLETKQSALAKLAALGLTEAEAQAIVGQ